MKSKRLGRSTALVAVMVTALSVLALPAFGKATKGTASITAIQGVVGETAILAGTTNAVYTLQVTNAPAPSPVPPGSPAPTPYNLVSIIPPPDLTVSVQGLPPAGWTQQVSTEGHVIFETTSQPIAAGQSKSFGVEVHVDRPELDAARVWTVQVSDNAGQQIVEQAPAAGGTLTSTIKVLRVIGAEITAPVGAADHTVTEQQSNTIMRMRLQNAGSGDLTVDPSLAKASGGSSFTAGQPKDSAGNDCPCTLGPQSEDTYDFPITFGAAGNNLVIRGGASGDTDPSRVPATARATAIPANSPPITVMTKTALTYVNNSLQPNRVASGKEYAFQVTLAKGGAVSSTLDQANTTFKFGPPGGTEFSATLSEPTRLEASTNVIFTFANTLIPTTIPDSSAGYGPRIRVVGTDQNDNPFTIDPTVGNNIVVDSLGPIIEALLTPPPSSVEGTDDATSNGRTLGMEINLRDDPDTLCTGCTLDKAVLRQFGASGVSLGKDIDVTDEFAGGGGAFTGEYSGDYDPAAFGVRLVVTASDTTTPPNTTEEPSPLVDVDNVRPSLSFAKTGGPAGNDLRRIDLCFTERVGSVAVLARDYRVDNHTVTAAQATNRDGSAATMAGFDCVRLTLGEDLGRNEEPNVTYNADVGPLSSPARNFDRVDLEMANDALRAVDGIIPRQPILQTVSIQNYGEQPAWTDGKFYSNDTSPDFRIAAVDAGDLVTLYRDVNDNGTIEDGTDEQLGSAVSGGGTVLITSNSIGTAPENPEIGLLIEVVDPRFNVGPLGGGRLVFDFVPPQATSGAVTGTNIQVNFDDVLRFGRDFAIDWPVFGTKDGILVRFTIGEVSGAGQSSRTLLIDDTDYTPPTAVITEVKYDYLKSAALRYKDRAGNDLADFGLTI